MAVKLSSDLIMDVMRNADPLRRSTAVAKLRGLEGEADRASGFESVMSKREPEVVATNRPALSLPFTYGRNAAREETTPYQNFERVFLRSLFETLLPDSESGSFGTGPSAGVWRSSMADQLAGVYAESGGVGIANMLSDGSRDTPTPLSQWPYFSLPKISGMGG